MLVKASLAACALVCSAVLLSSIDLRRLYNEMYPVNGLRRDVLNLCHQAEPTFVRAVEADRVGCYDSMPDPVEIAIGWVRTSDRLAAMHKPTPVEIAERLLIAAIQEHRLDRLGSAQFSGYGMVTGGAAYACDEGKSPIQVAAKSDPALALPDDNLVLRLARGDRAALAALGLTPSHGRPAGELPILSLGGAGGSGAGGSGASGSGSPDRRDVAVNLSNPAPAVGLGADSVPPQSPPATTAGICRTPA